ELARERDACHLQAVLCQSTQESTPPLPYLPCSPQELAWERDARHLQAVLCHVAEQPARRDAAARRFLEITSALSSNAACQGPLELLL
ncbi:unnamed protein product, partial [Closterium sp. NIES-53]